MNERPRIAFVDYHDVFEDFYPHYGVDQAGFAATFAATGNHALVELLQQYVGDVVWYAFSLRPLVPSTTHERSFEVRMLRSSLTHRRLWSWFYDSPRSWRRQRWYQAYATAASWLAPLSVDFVRAIHRDRPDIYVSQDYATGKFDLLVLLTRLLRRPLVAYHAGSAPDRYTSRWAKNWSIRRADLLLVASGRERDDLVDRYGVDSRRITALPTPIDTEVYRPAERTRDRPYLLYVGRLENRVKRADALVTAFASIATDHPTVDLVIVGDGPDRDSIAHLAATLSPGRVDLVGWVDDEYRKAELYAGALALILPSASEGFPTVVGEALACGTPVLASDVGAVCEVVHDGRTGWLIPPGDDDALRHRLRDVIALGERAALRQQARDVAVSQLSVDVVGRRLREAIAPLLPRGLRRRR